MTAAAMIGKGLAEHREVEREQAQGDCRAE